MSDIDWILRPGDSIKHSPKKVKTAKTWLDETEHTKGEGFVTQNVPRWKWKMARLFIDNLYLWKMVIFYICHSHVELQGESRGIKRVYCDLYLAWSCMILPLFMDIPQVLQIGSIVAVPVHTRHTLWNPFCLDGKSTLYIRNTQFLLNGNMLMGKNKGLLSTNSRKHVDGKKQGLIKHQHPLYDNEHVIKVIIMYNYIFTIQWFHMIPYLILTGYTYFQARATGHRPSSLVRSQSGWPLHS